jgi:integrase/recombinase XerD
MKNIIAERVIHDNAKRVSIRFPYDAGLVRIIRGIPGSRWSERMNCWHFPDSADIIEVLLSAFSGKAYVDYTALKPNLADKIKAKRDEEQLKNSGKKRELPDTDLPSLNEKGMDDVEKFRRWMESHRYPSTTIRTYTGMLVTFLRFVTPKDATECTSDDLVRIVDEYILPLGLSHSYQNQTISAVKKFYGKVYRTVIDPGEFTRPRPQHRLPNVLSKEEVKRVLDAPVNEKHRVMLSLI